MTFDNYDSSLGGSYTMGALTYTAELSDGSALPTCIDFNDSTRTFTVSSIDNDDVDNSPYTVKIKADEGNGLSNYDETFTVTLAAFVVVLDAPNDILDMTYTRTDTAETM
jgi:hypothetical protein